VFIDMRILFFNQIKYRLSILQLRNVALAACPGLG